MAEKAFNRSAAERMLKVIISAFEAGDAALLQGLKHPDNPDTDKTYHRTLMKAGYRVARHRISEYVAPSWSIMRSMRFEPTPEFTIEVDLENARGNKTKLYFAFARVRKQYCQCYYVEREKPSRLKAKQTLPISVDLRKDSAAIRRFVKAVSIRLFRDHPDEPVTGIHVWFSRQSGCLDLYFWTNPKFKPFALDARHCKYSESFARHLWRRQYDKSFETETEIITLAGVSIRTKPSRKEADIPACSGESRVIKAIGSTIKSVLLDGLKDGLIKSVPFASAVWLVVQDDEDNYGWSKQVGN